MTEFTFPLGFPNAAKEFCTKLLEKEPTNRLGINGVDEIKQFPFFKVCGKMSLFHWIKGWGRIFHAFKLKFLFHLN